MFMSIGALLDGCTSHLFLSLFDYKGCKYNPVMPKKMVLEKSGKRCTLSPTGMLFAEKSILNEVDALETFILLIAKKEKKLN